MKPSSTIKNRGRLAVRRQRQGLSLIETVVMASVTSAMLVMATGWIHQTMKQSSRFRTEHREQLAVAKLSQHFRKHVWLSKTADTSEANSISLTNPDDEQFTYSLSDQHLDFAHRNASGKLQAIERFALPASSQTTFSKTGESMVMIKIENPTGVVSAANKTNTVAPRTSLVIKSTLARWLPASMAMSTSLDAEASSEAEEVPQ